MTLLHGKWLKQAIGLVFIAAILRRMSFILQNRFPYSAVFIGFNDFEEVGTVNA